MTLWLKPTVPGAGSRCSTITIGKAAERELKRAIDLNPGAPLPHQRYGTYLTILGRFEESLTEIRLAQELNPLDLQNLS